MLIPQVSYWSRRATFLVMMARWQVGRDWGFSSVAIISASVLALGNLVAMVLFLRGNLHFGGSGKQSSDVVIPCLSDLIYPVVEMMSHDLAFEW